MRVSQGSSYESRTGGLTSRIRLVYVRVEIFPPDLPPRAHANTTPSFRPGVLFELGLEHLETGEAGVPDPRA